jgi:transposase|tara:strand:- start:924 stop:1253 length:330 start_codon:yes stop_codon:yes gene_type:complete
MGGVFMRKKERRRYDASFKLEALRLADSPEKSDAEVERELGLFGGAIKDWRKQLRKRDRDESTGSEDQTSLEDETRLLRRELEIAREERDILKKAIAIFSKTKKPNSGS